MANEPRFAADHVGGVASLAARHQLAGGVLLDDTGHPRGQWTCAPAALSVQRLGPGQSVELAPVGGLVTVPGPGPPDGVAHLAAHARVRHPPRVGRLGRVGGRRVVPARGQVAVLRGLPRNGPAVPTSGMVHNKPASGRQIRD